MYTNQEWGTYTQQIIDEAPPSPMWANNEPFQNIERYEPGHTDLISARAVYSHEYTEPGGITEDGRALGLQKRLILQELRNRFPPELLSRCDNCHEFLNEDEALSCDNCESVWCNDCLDFATDYCESRTKLYRCPDCEECRGCEETSWDDIEHRDSNSQYNRNCRMLFALNT